jgi:hypothetical protein
MNRRVEPEWLDDLPPEDARAVHSRRDLQRLNACMGHARIVRGILQELLTRRPPARLVELGAGDGVFFLNTLRPLSRRWPNVEIVLVDRRPVVSEETRAGFGKIGWRLEVVAADVFDWLPGAPQSECIVANLFLHHFKDAELAALLALAARQTDALAACEPRRSRAGLWTCGLLGLIGCNGVTRHDAAASVRAGFRGREISAAWPDGAWNLREGAAGVFNHVFSAQRRAVS